MMATITKMSEHCSGGNGKHNLTKGEIRIIKFRKKIKPLSAVDNSRHVKSSRESTGNYYQQFCKGISYKMIIHDIDFL